MKSKFNVVSFGSNHSFLFKTSEDYNDQTLESSLKMISKFSADMGGTEILNPLMKIFNSHLVDPLYPRSIFFSY